jgi:hypothetical protein
MDLEALISDLRQELLLVNQAIQSIERLAKSQTGSPPASQDTKRTTADKDHK